jgi:hypothetical protein
MESVTVITARKRVYCFENDFIVIPLHRLLLDIPFGGR